MVRDARWLWVVAIAALATAGFNLWFRLGSEVLTEWDESLYATSALEMTQSGNWVATTFGGALDYYNSKPPLNVWLLALVIQTFGVSLAALRLPSALAAWLTVLVLLVWIWRRFTPLVAVLSAWVLATCFGFVAVHSGRSANPDALLTLEFLLIVVTLDTSRDAPARRVWLGPLLAGVFFVKGMAIVMPLLLIVFMEGRRRLTPRQRWVPLAVGFVLGAVPVVAWGVARWRIDRWAFFERMLGQDFVGVSTTVLDGQSGPPWFYLDILQKHHYEWVVAALVAALLVPSESWSTVRRALRFWKFGDEPQALLGCWVVITLLVPSVLQTKLAWYLNPFYPMFALGVGWLVAEAWSRGTSPAGEGRVLLVVTLVIASGFAEAKLVWHSYNRRAFDTSVQHLLVAEEGRLRGTRVYGRAWSRADSFVLRGMAEGEPVHASTVQDFLARSNPGEYFLSTTGEDHPDLVRVATLGDHGLFQRRLMQIAGEGVPGEVAPSHERALERERIGDRHPCAFAGLERDIHCDVAPSQSSYR
jgi:4-amino-4-deoxy-L-arabinose transferase-like glycosyltransferase